ncbi:MAG: hypothetical protein Q7U51_07370 [Methanoregula sp.]|nr:hypothetical protein [Methanoregula sp.]
MTSPIFMTQNGNEKISPMDGQQYEKEYNLQKIIAQNPELLFSDHAELKDIRMLLITCEAPVFEDDKAVYAARLDILFIDSNCIPVFVEVKLSTNPEIRRAVVGQVLEYASNAVVNWKIKVIQEMFSATCKRQRGDPTEVLTEFLGPDSTPDVFWDTVETNLRAGKIRIVIAADVLPISVKNIVQFLRNQMAPAEVLGVEVTQFTNGELQVFVPKVYGQASKASKKSGAKNKWDEPSFFSELATSGTPQNVIVAKRILSWAAERGLRIWWGEGVGVGSFFPLLDHNGTSHQVISVWTTPKIELQFQWMKFYPAFASDEKRAQFLQMIKTIPGIAIPDNKITGRPSFNLSLLNDESSLNQFIKVLDWFVAEIKAT